ncbi:MAG TPA: dienelactone hydrolase family protein [Bryobacteraceae bacterium]|jgi:carboxymethylenebutenolidase|nr:dienelactone hydrolase family protein [Bryobacteraceae bacterium]
MRVDQNRRDFLITKLSAGFAAAVLPVSAATITTDSSGLLAGEVQIPTKDGQIPAYRAMPTDSGGHTFPVVLVVQEVFGVHEHIKDICRRLAKSSYMAIAPALYAREGDPSTITDVQELMRKIVSRVPDAQVMSDLDATADWAAVNHGNTDRMALTGFCWGGRIAWLYAAHSPKLKASAAWYGRLAGPVNPLQPKNPIDVVKDLKAPVIGFYGGKDASIPQDSIVQMRDALITAGKTGNINVYPEAQHGFNADYRPSYNEYSATDAWKKMLTFFQQKGV